MYEAFFGFRELPFSPTPNPRYLWPSETHQEGLALLYYGITGRKGFLLLTGEVGAGKTTLLRATLERLPDDADVALVMNTCDLSPLDLFKLIAAEYRLPGPFQTKADYLIALNALLIQRIRTGVNSVLIIDEAQNLGKETLAEVRLLSNLETETDKLLQIVLTGQPELRSMLADPSLRQLRQRIALEHHVDSLRASEVASYLEHRIQVAGGRYDQVFPEEAARVFFDFSQGCPRLINLLADRVLLAAFAKELRPVPLALVESKAKEIQAAAAPVPDAGG